MKNFLIGENKCMTEGVTKETFETQFSASDDKINQEINNRKQEIGELSTLSTDEKSNIVSAINEVKTQANDADTRNGDISTLTTDNKTTFVSALNEVDANADTANSAANEALTNINNINTKIGSLDSLSTTEKSSIVESINEVFEKSYLSEETTYYVDSDQALLDWANKVEGNNYSVVTIKKGEWTSTVGVNLTTAGTKAIKGDYGSKLIFSGVEKGLFYDTTPTGNDYWIRDVVVEGIEIPSDGFFSSFFQCTNLMNCSGYGKGGADQTSAGDYAGGSFRDCTNLSFCYNLGIAKIAQPEVEVPEGGNSEPVENGETPAESTAPLTNISFNNCTNLVGCVSKDRNNSMIGFLKCEYLTNCVSEDSVISESNGTKSINGYGFRECHDLIGCKSGLESGPESQTARLLAYYDCYNLTDCAGVGFSSEPLPNGAPDSIYSAFYSCHNLINCNGYGKGVGPTGAGIGYYDCYRLSQCIGLGTGENEGYGFCKCVGVINCDTHPGENSTTLNFKDCYSAFTTEDDRFLCNGSAEGGFNGKDIPEAIKTNSVNYTYVVDSDQALLDWANNKEGNDYSTVLIRKGEWTSSVGINLTIVGTKVVQGEVGSKLVFNEVEKGLYYDAPTTSDYWMKDVTVEVSHTGTGFTSSFNRCTNLTNCTSNANGIDDGIFNGHGFQDCTNLTNCTGNANGYGFFGCTNLTNCTSNANTAVFRECTNLTNCTGTGEGVTFWRCTDLTHCTATGSRYGFQDCKGVSHCKEGDTPCTTALFRNSYSSLVEDERFLCNGTAEGGFNGEDVSSYGSVGNIQDLTTTDKSSIVAAINEINNNASSGGGSSGGGSGSDGIVPTFTYEVNSDQALLDWANNASGNDYSAVLIRRGTWTSTVGVNLTTSGTKVVVGEAGSKLVFNEVEKGLFYDTAHTTPDYWIRDVTVECTGTDTGYGTSFCNCTNLTNCTGTRASKGYGFSDCTNLTNCTGTGTGNGTGTGYGFYYCTNLTNCTGNGNGYGFYYCTNLTNCTGNGIASGTGNSNGYGFHKCTNLTNCTGTGTANGNGYGYGFHSCKRVSGCKKGSKCTTSVFGNSYASFSETSTYACADTPEGGFNEVDNLVNGGDTGEENISPYLCGICGQEGAGCYEGYCKVTDWDYSTGFTPEFGGSDSGDVYTCTRCGKNDGTCSPSQCGTYSCLFCDDENCVNGSICGSKETIVFSKSGFNGLTPDITENNPEIDPVTNAPTGRIYPIFPDHWLNNTNSSQGGVEFSEMTKEEINTALRETDHRNTWPYHNEEGQYDKNLPYKILPEFDTTGRKTLEDGTVVETIGQLTEQAHDSGLERINLFRKMMGIPSVYLDPGMSKSAQAGAFLLGKHGGKLQHGIGNPGMDQDLYRSGNQAIKNGLLASYPFPYSVDNWMQDPGQMWSKSDGTAYQGVPIHRVYMTAPVATKFGYGYTTVNDWDFSIVKSDQLVSPQPHGVSSLRAIETSGIKSGFEFVSWPAPGFCPLGPWPKTHKLMKEDWPRPIWTSPWSVHFLSLSTSFQVKLYKINKETDQPERAWIANFNGAPENIFGYTESGVVHEGIDPITRLTCEPFCAVVEEGPGSSYLNRVVSFYPMSEGHQYEDGDIYEVDILYGGFRTDGEPVKRVKFRTEFFTPDFI